MAFLKELPANAVLLDVFKRYPAHFLPLIEYHQRLLRGPSPLSIQQRELLAAYVSALNDCSYCAGVHEQTARCFGVDGGLLRQLVDDLDSAPIEERLKPLFRFVQKLTLTPARMTEADAAAVFAAGWDDRALHDAVATCALFNCMNRLVEGFGIDAGPDYFATSAERLASPAGYGALTRMLAEAAAEPAESGGTAS